MIARILIVAFIVVASVFEVCADELDNSLKKVVELSTAKNYPKALEELAWARQELEKLHTSRLQTFFPDDINGFKGGKLETNSALGFVTLTREYTGPKGPINLELSGGSSGAPGGMGNLGQLGKMAAMMGGTGTGQETIRIEGKTATLEKSEESATLTVYLDSGSILKLDMSENADAEVLKKFAQALKLKELEDYLKG